MMSATVSEPNGVEHLRRLELALHSLRNDLAVLDRWGSDLAVRLMLGGRVLVAGNGGSAAQAQHLTAELVGRYRSERAPLSAIALHADTSSFSAIVNDYGAEEVFARQIQAHGRDGDVLVALSTSGRSPNILRAADVAAANGLTVWSLCGAAGSPLEERSHESVAVTSSTPTVQEVHQVCIHLLCDAVDRTILSAEPAEMPHDRAPLAIAR